VVHRVLARLRHASAVPVVVVFSVLAVLPGVGMTPVGTQSRIQPAPGSKAVAAGGQATSGRADAPGSAWSRYMRTADPTILREMGCGDAKAVRSHRQPTDAVVVLDFGKPASAGGHEGTVMFGTGFHPIGWIVDGAHAYAQGFRRCLGPVPATLRVALGTSNIGRNVTYRHGRAWGQMVEEANAWAFGTGVAPTVTFDGADDIEPGWSGPEHARSWVRGYASATTRPYYDYGGLAGCPPVGNCEGRWTMEDLWYVAWGAPNAIPLPEIYTRNGISANQWYQLAVFSYERHHRRMAVAGVMSQHGACAQVHDPCSGLDNRPGQAWAQLSSRLNADRRTAVRIRWSTDILWQRLPRRGR